MAVKSSSVVLLVSKSTHFSSKWNCILLKIDTNDNDSSGRVSTFLCQDKLRPFFLSFVLVLLGSMYSIYKWYQWMKILHVLLPIAFCREEGQKSSDMSMTTLLRSHVIIVVTKKSISLWTCELNLHKFTLTRPPLRQVVIIWGTFFIHHISHFSFVVLGDPAHFLVLQKR